MGVREPPPPYKLPPLLRVPPPCPMPGRPNLSPAPSLKVGIVSQPLDVPSPNCPLVRMNLQEEGPWQGFCLGNPGSLGRSSCRGTEISRTGEPWRVGRGSGLPEGKGMKLGFRRARRSGRTGFRAVFSAGGEGWKCAPAPVATGRGPVWEVGRVTAAWTQTGRVLS